ncbi:hypothetical protein C4J81_06620 [Deltaproteobacteria bacterium Smac51]|nr:hypothetical protein C4J81_06620 [Deltaproteobacteria bacterium Smac51]
MLNMKKPKYMARVEYRSLQPEIEKRLAEGYCMRFVFDEMTRDGRLTMGYTTFCDYVRGGGHRLHSRKKPGRLQPQSAGRPARPANRLEPFVHDKDVELKDLV